MENQIANHETQTKQDGFWNPSEKAEIVKTLAVIINGQKAYGKDASVQDTFAYYRMKLDGRFTASDVLSAIGLYTDRSNDLPTPADLINLMVPPPPAKVTTAEFIHAKEQQKAHGYPIYSEWKAVIEQFEMEQEEARNPVAPIHDQKVLSIVQNSVKRIA